MIAKLPIVIDYQIINNSKIIFHNFKIKHENNYILLDVIYPYKNLNFVKIPCVNRYNCIYYLKVSLPMKIEIINNMLISPYFFVVSVHSDLNLGTGLDFFDNLLNALNDKLNKKYCLLNKNNFEKYITDILKYTNKFSIKNKYKNILDFLKNFYEYINITLNTSFLINYLHEDFNIKTLKTIYGDLLKKKIMNISNYLKNLKFSFKMSSNFEIKEHLKNFERKKVEYRNLKKNNNYFVFINNKKLLTIKIINKKDNIIKTEDNFIPYNKYDIYYYPPFFNNLLNKDCLFNYFTSLDYYDKIINKIFVKNKIDYYKNIFKFFINNEKINEYLHDILNLEIEFDEIEEEFENVIKYNFNIYKSIELDINSDEFKKILNENDNNKIEILKLLFKKYNFPIEYNKKNLEKYFEKILYISFLNYNLIIDRNDNKINLKDNILSIIPVKLKTLYLNLMKIYIEYIEYTKFENIIYNPKIYNDYIHFEVIKIIFESNYHINNLFKLNEELYYKLKILLKDIIIIKQICKRLKWKNISKNLNYLNFLYNNDYIMFFMDRLNKTILPDNFDSRIKKILINPFEMYKYLKRRKDFVKWTIFLGDKIKDLYNISIIFNDSEIKKLGNLIYLLFNIKTQNLKDPTYSLFINFCKKNEKLILNESRINMKIKEKFKFMKLNLNLGYVAKHLTWDNNSVIFMKDEEFDTDLKEQLKQISKKYYKYKGKYIKLKNDTIESASSVDSAKNNKNIIEL